MMTYLCTNIPEIEPKIQAYVSHQKISIKKWYSNMACDDALVDMVGVYILRGM